MPKIDLIITSHPVDTDSKFVTFKYLNTFTLYRQAMKEVLCNVESLDEESDTVTSRLTSRQSSRASSMIKLRKISSTRLNPDETARMNPIFQRQSFFMISGLVSSHGTHGVSNHSANLTGIGEITFEVLGFNMQLDIVLPFV